MMKKIFSKVLICIITLSSLFTLAGCEFTSKNEADNNFNKSEKNSNTSNSKNNSTANNDTITFDMRGIQMAIPSYLEEANVFSKSVWKGETSNGNMIYYDIDYLPDYGSVASIDSYSLNDTPDIMWTYILDVVDEYYPAGVKSTISIDSETNKNMLGYDVIRRTGKIHTEKYGESHELSYAAYYGLFDLQNGAYKKIPTVWIAFSESSDSQTQTDLENIVDLAFNNAKFNK